MIINSQLSRSLWDTKDTIMKRLNKTFNAFAILLLGIAFTVAACSTTGLQRSEAVQSDMKTVDNDIKLIIVQLDAIGASLDELTKPGQADVRRAFEVFEKNVSKMEKLEKDFSNHANQMTASGKTYFEEWDKNKNKYDNPEIQRNSDERRAALGQTYDRIGENSTGVKEAFKTYVSDVTQISTYISNDLTTAGITSIASLADNTVRNGAHLKSELETLQSAIEDARAEMVQSGVTMN